MIKIKSLSAFLWTVIPLYLLTACGEDSLQFAISFPDSLTEEAQDGRILLLISDNNEAEPRFQISDGPDTKLVFGIDVNELKAGDEAIISDTVLVIR
jgi:hypothetical protein